MFRRVSVDGNIVFATRTGSRLMELSYSLNADEYLGNELSIRTRNYFDFKEIKKIIYQPEPIKTLWVVMTDGSLYSCTYDRKEGIVAFTEHQLGGTDVVVEDAEVQISPDGSTNDVWFIVKRTVNGGTVRYVEYLEDFKKQTQEDWFFVDCGLTYDGTPVNTLSSLDHMEGETLAVFVDGMVHNDVTVTGGEITLDDSYSKIHIGYRYTSTIKTLPLEVGNKFQTTLGETKKITDATIRIYESLGFQIGPDENELEEAFFNGSNAMSGAPIPPYTGSKNITYNGGYEEEAQVIIQTDYPMPLNISSIILNTAVSN